MKRIKKIGALAASVALGIVGLAGCSGSSSAEGKECIGKWVIESMVADGEVATAEDLAEMAELGFDMNEMFALDLKEDGTADIIIFEEATSGTWKGAEGACDVTVEGETLTFPLEDGNLVMEEEDTKIIFKRG